jgi:hypothetical protein
VIDKFDVVSKACVEQRCSHYAQSSTVHRLLVEGGGGDDDGDDDGEERRQAGGGLYVDVGFSGLGPQAPNPGICRSFKLRSELSAAPVRFGTCRLESNLDYLQPDPSA